MVNPNLAAFAAMTARPPMGAAPQGIPPGMVPGMNGGAPPAAMQARPPMGTPPGGAPGPMPPGASPAPQRSRFTPQEMAALGRYGDSIVAHLTPGEIAVPPQVQTPKVLAELKQAFHKAHVSPQQFTAGSPASSINPSTGAPEYNFWSALLPALGGLAGAFIAPELLPAWGAMGAGLGAGVGATAGGLAGGQKPGQALLGGGLAGLGTWGLGSLMGGANAADGAAASQDGGSWLSNLFGGGGSPAGAGAVNAAAATGNADAAAAMDAPGASTLSNAAPQPSPGMFSGLMKSPWLPLAAGVGGAMMMSRGMNNTSAPTYPPGFNTPRTPVAQLPSAQVQLGQNVYKGPQPNFNGYNPYQVGMGGGWNFFPTPTA